jgi:hypothetical protein
MKNNSAMPHGIILQNTGYEANTNLKKRVTAHTMMIANVVKILTRGQKSPKIFRERKRPFRNSPFI